MRLQSKMRGFQSSNQLNKRSIYVTLRYEFLPTNIATCRRFCTETCNVLSFPFINSAGFACRRRNVTITATGSFIYVRLQNGGESSFSLGFYEFRMSPDRLRAIFQNSFEKFGVIKSENPCVIRLTPLLSRVKAIKTLVTPNLFIYSSKLKLLLWIVIRSPIKS